MKSFKTAFIFFCVLLTSSLGLADEAARFRNASLQFIEQAAANGHVEVEGISIAEIRKAAQEVRIQHMPSINMTTGNRKCAIWRSGSTDFPAYITVNQPCTEIPDASLGAIATHEIVGAKFKRDLNYEMVTRMAKPKVPVNPNNLRWQANRQQQNTNGGSTGVGGGGDNDDVKFKLAGLDALETLAKSQATLFGIPVEMLQEALHQMHASPATDIANFMQFNARNTRHANAKIFVQSQFYRSNDPDLGLWALYAARMLVTYSPYELGFVDNPQDELDFTIQQMRNLKAQLLRDDALSKAAWAFEQKLIDKVSAKNP